MNGEGKIQEEVSEDYKSLYKKALMKLNTLSDKNLKEFVEGKMYNKKEVEKLFEKFESDRGRYYPQDAADILPLRLWIENNLK